MSVCHWLSYRDYISRVHTESTAELGYVIGPREEVHSCCSKSNVGMCIYIYLCVCIYIYMCVCVYIYVCIYICVCIYIYIYNVGMLYIHKQDRFVLYISYTWIRR